MACPQRLLIADHHGAEHPVSPLAGLFRPLEALGVDLRTSRSPEETRAILTEGPYDVLVVDAQGLRDVMRVVERDGKPTPVPVLIVADPEDPIPAVVAGRSLRGFAWDMVHRDAPAEELLLRAERLVEQTSTLAELERARYHASHDDLTGLLRPARFTERLQEHFSAAQRHRLEFALVVIDLDRFGRVNKDFDHMVGDELIARVGSVVRMSLRTEDVGARIGGDEFALILPYTQRVDAARVVTRLAGRFRALSGPPPTALGTARRAPVTFDPSAEPPTSITVSASIGFDTCNGADVTSVDELRSRAERALRAAKERGGNQAVYFRNLAASDGRTADEYRTNPVRSVENELARGVDLEDE